MAVVGRDVKNIAKKNAPTLIDLFIQLGVVLGAITFYFITRNLTQGAKDRAISNGQAVLDVESWLHIDWEAWLQSQLVRDHTMATLFNWIYIWLHWPVITATLVSLFFLRRDAYGLLRNAMLISGAIGLVIFATFPVAPPRLLPDNAYVDTVTTWSHSYRVFQPPGFTNQYAAMPSLHLGWNILVGIVVFHVATRWWIKAFAVIAPTLMAVAIVVTANHYILDGVAGGVIALLALAIANAWRQHSVQAAIRIPLQRGREHRENDHSTATRRDE